MTEIPARSEPKRVGDVLLLAADYLKKKGRESPRLGAEVLLGHILACDRIGVYLRFEEALSEESLDRYRNLIRRRGLGEPVAYLVGHKEFYSLPFQVDPSVLIPRPDTEALVRTVIQEVKARQLNEPRVLDLGTGPGTVLLALSSELKSGDFVGTDISREALAMARRNVENLFPEARVSLREGDWFAALEKTDVPFDVIVCNPPYVPSAQLETLPTEISRYEPRLALDGGTDGLDPYRRLAPEVAGWLNPGGFSAFEIGDDQGESVARIFTEQGLEVELRRDDANRDRVVLVNRADGR